MANPTPLKAGKFYHIYNRGNNRENIFVEERNYAYFLKLWGKYVSPVADTLAYCLLRNHFHAVIEINERIRSPAQASRQFSNLFNAYARAVNLASRRTGALFERPFHRIEVRDENYLARLIVYAHQNPQKHRFVSDFRDWPHSSFRELSGRGWALSNRDKVMRLFGGKEMFLQIHTEILPRADPLET